MIFSVLFLFCVYLTGINGHAQTYQLQVIGHISNIDKIEYQNQSTRIDIWLENGTKLYRMEGLSMETGRNELGRVEIPKPYKLARIEINIPGYKKVTRNCFIKKSKLPHTLSVQLGEIVMKKNKGPIVSHSTYSSSADSLHRIRITIYNPTSTPILFSKLSIKTKVRESEAINCNKPAGLKLFLSNEMSMSSATNELQSKITDGDDNFSFPMSGAFVQNHCSGISEIALESKLDYLVPAKGHSKVAVFFPDAFTVTETRKLDGSIVGTSSSQQKIVFFREFDYLTVGLTSDSPSLIEVSHSIKI